MNNQNLNGLTTTKSEFIENSKNQKKIFIHQPYSLYTEENQIAWNNLCKIISPQWEKFANGLFLKGLKLLKLKFDSIPCLEEINHFLFPLTGFQAKAVSGYVPAHLFFHCLKNREFPTTVTIRDSSKLSYLPEPDIFHDLAGHVPMHTDKKFANILVKFGSLAEQATNRCLQFKDLQKRLEVLSSNIRALARFFWFTIEFGIIRENNELRVYGSGLLSSFEEIEHAVTSSSVQRHSFQIEWVINQGFTTDIFQPLLFIIDSFEHLFEQVELLEEGLKMGKLDNVALGEPSINLEEIQLFLEHTNEEKK